MKKLFYPFLLLAALSVFTISCEKDTGEPQNQPSTGGGTPVVPQPPLPPTTSTPDPDPSVHLAMGNPSNATTDVANFTNYLMVKPQYTLSYHRDRGIPNWVSWHLDAGWLGSTSRQDDFRADATLPAGWYRVTESDYEYAVNGFDRGHNTPSADRTNSVANNSATFLMTNMIPQAPTNNQQTWAKLEDYCRALVGQGNELYIIMGNYGAGGTGNQGLRTTIAGGKVTVPANIWKVVVVLPKGENDLSRVTASTRVIAINTPNNNNVTTTWDVYRTTVDAIETATGLNLLSNLPEALQTTLEAKKDTGPTN